jgi:hypothetical protein
MQSQFKSTSAGTSNESAYTHERKSRALVLETADAVREEQRRVNFAAIDSNASKWRYTVSPKG